MSQNPTGFLAIMFLSALCALPVRAEADSPASKHGVKELAQAIQACKALNEELAPYDAVFRRNPMQSLVDTEGGWVGSLGLNSGLAVQGIIWSDKKPLAIIDDALYATGSTVGPYTIEEIQRDGIKVARGAEHLLIPLDRGLQSDQAK